MFPTAEKEGTFTWFFADEEIEEDNENLIIEKVDEVSSKLVINKAMLSDSGVYTCSCEYDTNGEIKKATAQVFVYGKDTGVAHTKLQTSSLLNKYFILFFLSILLESIKFNQTPTYHEFLKTEDALIPCIATGKPEVEIKWYQGDTLLGADGMRGTLATASSGYLCGMSCLVLTCMAPHWWLLEGWRWWMP